MANSAMPAAPPAISPTSTDDPFTAAYREYRPMVRNTIIGRLALYGPPDVHLAEDLTQNVFLDLFKGGDRVRYGDRRLPGLLKLMAKRRLADHYRVMRNSHERPADTGHWSFTNREMGRSVAGTYTPASTGFRTAAITPRPGDSDPDPDEALRRARTGGKR